MSSDPTSMSIRFANRADALAIAEMSRDLIEKGLGWSWTKERVTRCLRHPDTNVVVAIRNADRAGFGIMKYGEDEAHLLLLHHAYLHWAGEGWVYNVGEQTLNRAISDRRITSHPPRAALYLQLPELRVWGSPTADAPPEPLDGTGDPGSNGPEGRDGPPDVGPEKRDPPIPPREPPFACAPTKTSAGSANTFGR